MTTRGSLLAGLLGLMVVVFAIGCDSGSAGTSVDGDLPGDPACDCPYGCDDLGECLPGPCETSTDCPPGQICDGGYCQNAGETDGDEDTPNDGDLDGKPNETDGDLSEAEADGDIDLEFETDVPHDENNPWIVVDPLRIDFGAVPLHSTRDRDLTISNIGAQDLVVDEIYYWYEPNEPVQELSLTHDALPITLASGDQALVTLLFESQDIIPDEDMLIIHSNDPSEPNVGIPVTTDIKASAAIEVNPLEVAFGTVRLGHYEETVTLRNLGGLAVLIAQLELDSQSDEITVDGIPAGIGATTPYSLDPGANLALTVNYDPVVNDGVEDTGTLHIETNDVENPRFTVPISGTPCQPEIDVLPTILDYSSVNLGDSATECFTLENSGCGLLAVSSIAITEDAGGAYVWQAAPTAPEDIPAGESREYCVTFTPDSPDTGNGMVTIESDDDDEPTVEIPLSSEVVPPNISCTPDELLYGQVAIGSPQTLSVTCTATTSAPIEIGDLVIDPPPGVFAITNTPATTLNLGDESIIEITYDPTTETADAATLTIPSNDPDNGSIDVPLSGSGYIPNDCPVALISIAEPPEDQIEQYVTVTLNGAGSSDPDPGDSIAEYIWTVLSRPPGSTSPLTSQGDVRPTLYMDVAGDYVVELQVRDTLGLLSCVADQITITAAQPSPDIHCEPLALNYGEVAIGSTFAKTLSCRNDGFGPLAISQYEMVSPAAGVFSITNTPKTTLAYSESTLIQITYAPQQVGEDLGTLRIHSDDPDEPLVEVSLRGGTYAPNTCPVADFVLLEPPIDEIFVGDRVKLDASGSYDPDAGDSIYQYIWSFDSKPAASQTEIRPFGYPKPSFYVDQPGTYVVKLIVTDTFYEPSCQAATLTLVATLPPADIVCSPMVVNYGVLAIGDTQTQTVVCENVGRGLLHISSYLVDTPTAGLFSVVNTPVMAVPPGDFTTFEVRYAPTTPDSSNGALTIQSNDPAEPEVAIDLIGNSYDPNNCPTAVIGVTSPPLDRLKPLDTVQLDGTGSSDPDAGDAVAEYIWSIDSRPSGSTSQLNTPNAARPTLFLDLAGTYRIKLEVRDTKGMLSCSPAYVNLDVIPRELIHVELTWSTNEGDMDLHLVKPGGSLWSSNDCYFSNLEPNWSGYGRPSLDIDDEHGRGPENINLDDPGNGTYRVYVHYWNTWGERDDVNVTIRIYIWGALVATYQKSWPDDYEHYRWPVADINWSGYDATVTSLGSNFESDGHGSRRSSGKYVEPVKE